MTKSKSGRGRCCCAGFTLLEVLVAFSIVSLTLTIVFSIFSAGLRTTARAADITRATQLAEGKLLALSVADTARPGVEEGAIDERYRWRSEVQIPDWWRSSASVSALAPRRLTVDVSWREGSRDFSVSLTTLRLVQR